MKGLLQSRDVARRPVTVVSFKFSHVNHSAAGRRQDYCFKTSKLKLHGWPTRGGEGGIIWYESVKIVGAI